MESNNNPSTTATSNRMSWKVTEHHKTTQSHANGTMMGRFPRLTPVRLSPQVPDHMVISSLLPYIVVSTHQGVRAAASAGKLCSSTDRAQVFECTELVRAVGHFQTTLAQVLGKCKSVCTCLPLAFLPFRLLLRRVKLPKPEQVSMDTPVVKLPRSFSKGVEGGRWPQENALQPYGERFDRLHCGTGLGVDFDNVRGVCRTVIFGEAGHRSLLQLLDPLNLSLQTIADVDCKPRILSVENVSFGASLEGVSVGFDEVLQSGDPSVKLQYFGGMVGLSLFNSLEQCLGDALQGVGVEVGAAVQDVSC